VSAPLTLLKLGGELLESPEALPALAGRIAALAADGPLVIVHGGGRDIDAECARRGLVKRAIDGLRITDAGVLEAVVAVLAGTVNTRLVASLATAGLRAVGLTGADAGVMIAEKSPPHRASSGELVDLGLVGVPASESDPSLLEHLVALGYLPVVATLGRTLDGELLNVNADTLASDLAARLAASRLFIAGGTPGVLDAGGGSIAVLDADHAKTMIAQGTASAGMVAKLDAGFAALARGVGDVRIISGRREGLSDPGAGTRLVTAGTRANSGAPGLTASAKATASPP
jgi:acetylglutamate kinase